MTVGSFFIISRRTEATLLDVTMLDRPNRSIWIRAWWAERRGDRRTTAPPTLHIASCVMVAREEGGRRMPMSVCYA